MDDISEIWADLLPKREPSPVAVAAGTPEEDPDRLATPEEMQAVRHVVSLFDDVRTGALSGKDFDQVEAMLIGAADRTLDRFFETYAGLVPHMIEEMAQTAIMTNYRITSQLTQEQLQDLAQRVDKLRVSVTETLRWRLDPQLRPEADRKVFESFDWPHRPGAAVFADPAYIDSLFLFFAARANVDFQVHGRVGDVGLDLALELRQAFHPLSLLIMDLPTPEPLIEAMDAYARAYRALHMLRTLRAEFQDQCMLTDATDRWRALRGPLYVTRPVGSSDDPQGT